MRNRGLNTILLFACIFLLVCSTKAGAYVLTGGTAPASAPAAGEPYGDFFGLTYTYSATDLTLGGSMPINLTRTHRSEYKDSTGHFISGAFGIGFNLNYETFLYSTSEVANPSLCNNSSPPVSCLSQVSIVLPNGSQVVCNATGSPQTWTQATFLCNSNPGPYYGATIEYDASIPPTHSPGWDVVLRDGTLYQYGIAAPLQATVDRNGNHLFLTYSSGQTGLMQSISSSSGRWINFQYNAANEIKTATDSGGRTITYGYNSFNRLITVTDSTNTVTTRIIWVSNGNGGISVA